jgi:hypothetical protein
MYYNAGAVVVNKKVVRLAPDIKSLILNWIRKSAKGLCLQWIPGFEPSPPTKKTVLRRLTAAVAARLNGSLVKGFQFPVSGLARMEHSLEAF